VPESPTVKTRTGPHDLALDLALNRLAALDERQARLLELRVFSGPTIEESAEALGCSHATVSRAWRHAQAWLRREMAGHVRDLKMAAVVRRFTSLTKSARRPDVMRQRPSENEWRRPISRCRILANLCHRLPLPVR
jgi:hypothetical protein